MSESQQNPPKRTTQTIEQENLRLTVKAGQLQYAIRQSKLELEMINDRLRDLALEYVQVKGKEDEMAKAVAEARAKDEAEKKAKEEAEKAQAEAGRAVLQAVSGNTQDGNPKPPQNPPSVDQTATQPGDGTKESASVSPVGQGQ